MTTVPRRLGKYELRQQVGRGNVGEVWKAYDLQLRREVAVKIIHTDLQSDPHFLSHFTQEGQGVTALHHTNIVQVHDIAVSHPPQQGSGGMETSAYIVTEYIEGQTLTNYINTTVRKGTFPSPTEIVYLFTSLGVAIDYAHQKGVIHGNIKPNNILLDTHNTAQFEAGEPVLTDFAFDKLIGSVGGIASPFYMSPEQAKGQTANNRSDIYSLGVILYELCTGVQPFRDSSSVAVMMQHINTLPTPPSLINSNIPAALSEVILRAMAKDTATRFQLASLLATAIADAYSLQTTLSPVQRAALAAQEDNYRTSNRQVEHNSILGVSQPIPKLPPRIYSQPLPAISQPLSTASGKQPVVKPAAHMPQTPHTPQAPYTPQKQITTGKLPIPSLPTPDAHEIATTQPTLLIPTNQAAATTRPIERTTRPQQVLPLRTAPPSFPSPLQQPLPSGQSSSRSKVKPISMLIAALLLLLLLIGGGIGVLLTMRSNSTGTIVGHAFFQDDALGHDDQLHLDLQNVPAPAAGTKYVAWLQENAHTFLPLGTLTVNNGTVSFLYSGNAQHTNLLASLQRLAITSESGNISATGPKGPTLYEAYFDTTTSHYIKNILYMTPSLPPNQGVVTEVINALKSMDDKAASITDILQNTHEYPLATRQATRIIEIIDGTQFALSSSDQPANVLSMLDVPVGLLSSPTQQGYLDALSSQLDQFQRAVGNNPTQLQHIEHVRNAVIDLKDWVQKMRLYDVQILKAVRLDDPALISVALQLKQVAADSYTGRTIPPNAGPQPIQGSAGAYQAYIECQYMATLDIKQVS